MASNEIPEGLTDFYLELLNFYSAQFINTLRIFSFPVDCKHHLQFILPLQNLGKVRLCLYLARKTNQAMFIDQISP